MHKTIRFRLEQLNEIQRVKRELGLKHFSKAVKFLIDSSLESRSFKDRQLFESALQDLQANILAINKFGVLVNQFVRISAKMQEDKNQYARSSKLVARKLRGLDPILKKNLDILFELSNNIQLHD